MTCPPDARGFPITMPFRSIVRGRALLAVLVAAGICMSTASIAEPQSTTAPDIASRQAVDPGFVLAETVSASGPDVVTRDIVQDAAGNIWFATFSGAVRYDGIVFTNVTNAASLKPTRAFSLLRDRDDNIWIGTAGAGVYRYDGSTYTQITARDGLSNDRVLSMMQDRDGNLWFGHQGAGATRYDGSGFTVYRARQGFTDGDVSSIAQDAAGRMWFGTRDGLFHFDGESFDTLDGTRDLPTGGFIPTLIDGNGHLWFGGRGGLHHYDGSRLRRVTAEPTWALEESSDGSILFGGETVLQRVWPQANVDGSEPGITEIDSAGGMFFDIFEDRDGTVWMGTFGVSQFDRDLIRNAGAATAPWDMNR